MTINNTDIGWELYRTFLGVLEEGSLSAMLSTLAYSPCEPYGKRVKWRSLSH